MNNNCYKTFEKEKFSPLRENCYHQNKIHSYNLYKADFYDTHSLYASETSTLPHQLYGNFSSNFDLSQYLPQTQKIIPILSTNVEL